MDIRIYYEDTDCGGGVYYGNYLKYFERARTQYLEERGLSVAGLMKEGTVFVVVHAEVDYRSPARYGDRLIIETARLAATDGNGKVKRLDKAMSAVLK